MKQIITTIALLNTLFINTKMNAQLHFQFVHNSPDPSLTHVKLWINDTVWVNDITFQSSTPTWTNIPFATTHTIGISALSATSQVQSLIQQTISTLWTAGHMGYMVLDGVTSNTTFPLSLNEINTGYTATYLGNQGEVFANFHNGCTMNYSLSIKNGTTVLAPDLAFTQTSGYVNWSLSGSGNQATLGVISGTQSFGNYIMPFQNFDAQGILIIMNGTMTPISAKTTTNGLNFGVVTQLGGAVTPLEQIVTTGTVTGIRETNANELPINIAPNPVNDFLNISFNSETNEVVNVELFDVTGNKITSQKYQPNSRKISFDLNVENLKSGIYFLNIEQGNTKKNLRFVRE